MIVDTRRDQMISILQSYTKENLDRIIAGGHRDAEGKVLINRFRRELGYSLKTVNVDIWNSITIAAKALDEKRKIDDLMNTGKLFVRKSKIGLEVRTPYKMYIPDSLHPYCVELGCTEDRHHPECAHNPCEKKNNNWDRFNAHQSKESAQQRLGYIWRDHKWSIAIGIQIIIATILKYKGII